MICKLIIHYALKHKVPAIILASIIHQESAFNPRALNDKAPVWSYGLGQLTLDTATSHCRLPKSQIYDIRKNIACSARVLKYQLERYDDKIKMAVSAYNAGTYTEKNYGYIVLVNKRIKENKCNIKGTYGTRTY